ncbi:hypothetical protein [Candidatus Magnetominusculus xianensis]|uniref:hypothetical protein n=1 Tax=Candidatus Magnetominusculus xianensis TaxID=1748249 RepID=UPI0012EEDC97|nr:hypothetical protein [Candidatus Magnetominusculus xianensis]MBF0404322.1 hypothetical protein [Nitrospirota bacterium]
MVRLLLSLALSVIISLNTAYAQEDLLSAVKRVRNDVKNTATNASNLNERLVIFFQWQRLLFEKGIDVSKAVDKERALKIEETAKTNPQQAFKIIDKAYADLEQHFGKAELTAAPQPRPEMRPEMKSDTRPDQLNQPPIAHSSVPAAAPHIDAQTIKAVRSEVKSTPTNEHNVQSRASVLNGWAAALKKTNPDSQKIYPAETATVIRAYINEDPKKAAAIVDRVFGDLEKLESGTKHATPKTQMNKKNVELQIAPNTEKVKITEGLPASQSGRTVAGFSTAFNARTADVKNGVVELEFTDTPLYIEPLSEASCTPNAANSPFVLISPEIEVLLDRNSQKYAGRYSQELGLRWIRFLGATGLNYMVYKSGGKDFASGDAYLDQLKSLYDDASAKGLNVITTIHPGSSPSASNPQAGGLGRLTFTDKDVKDYTEFLKAAITKLPKVKYFFVETEADYKFDPRDYALALSATYKTIKTVCPDCKIITAGYVNPERSYYKEVLDNLVIMKTAKAFDIFDMWHPFGTLNVYKGPEMEPEKIKAEFDKSARLLKSYGYEDVPIWIGETSYPSGSHNPYETGFSERRQAADLITRYLSAISAGVKKVLWTNIYDHNKFAGNFSYYDYTGFINNPKNGGAFTKKLSYYAYAMLIEKFKCLDEPVITRMVLKKGIEGYKIQGRNGQILYVLWSNPDQETK